MENFKRLEIISKERSPIKLLAQMAKEHLGLEIEWIEPVKLYWVVGKEFSESVQNNLEEVFCDEVLENVVDTDPSIYQNIHFDFAVEVSYLPGVTDNSARAALDAFSLFPALNSSFKVASGKIYLLKGNLSNQEVETLCTELLSNPLLEKSEVYSKEKFLQNKRFKNYQFPEVKLGTKKVQVYDLNVSDEELEALSLRNTWALSLDEMKHIQSYYKKNEVQEQRKRKGLPVEPTDVEMEILAQSWSEHCKHKIFASNINYSQEKIQGFKSIEKKRVEGLFKSFIKRATSDVQEKRQLDWLISVFSDNAGIVRFDSNIDVCVKVETHNSPSALDPYGGALTGILGVNRDILGCGQGARPIANTDVFCFADGDLTRRVSKPLPRKLLHPSRVFKGVHKGVEDGGNKSGIPTVNGAIHFDDDYAGKPLVYCGTVGVLPQKLNSGADTFGKRQKAGDVIVVIGGSVGMDGIHGATFSSMELTEGAPATVVQIGDPITQKRVSDFLMEARDKELFTSLTDNGAGGISSSIGEMAELSHGARIDLSKNPLKYPGLAPFEIMISESQERMSLSVDKNKLDEFLSLCKRRGVQAAVLGEFTDTGFLDVYYKDELVASLDLAFLHDSLIPMELKAHWNGPQERSFWHEEKEVKSFNDSAQFIRESFLEILSRPNIKSKEKWVRQYDHEVQASTIIKPFMGKSSHGPNNAGVVWMAPHGGEGKRALAISCGMCPQISHIDTYVMTQYAIDEAVRNFIANGGNVEKAALVDNFCWPDPIESSKNPDGAHKLAQLVRSCEALYDTALVYGMPFVSGKDSMKNDFHGKDENSQQIKISIPPTLLITAIADIDDCEKITTSDFKEEGELIFVIGSCNYQKINASEFSRLYFKEEQEVEEVHLEKNYSLYQKINELQRKKILRSVHDISDGGVATALFESCLGNNLGAEIKINEGLNPFALLFNESSGRFLVSLKREDCDTFLQIIEGHQYLELGRIVNDSSIKINLPQSQLSLSLENLEKAWRSE